MDLFGPLFLKPFSQLKTTNLDAEETAHQFDRAGYTIGSPDPQSGQAFWKVTINSGRKLSLQLYSTGIVQIWASTPEDEAKASKLLKQYARTIDEKPLRVDKYNTWPPYKDTANDATSLWLTALCDNFNLEYVIRALVADMLTAYESGKFPQYADSLQNVSDKLDRARLNSPFSPISNLLIQTIDPPRGRAPWIALESVSQPSGPLGYAIRTASAKMKQALFENDGFDKLASTPITSLETFIAQDVAGTIPESLREKLRHTHETKSPSASLSTRRVRK